MTSVAKTGSRLYAPRTSPLVAWGLLAGGVLFFVGGSLHPGEDPEGVTLKEHLHLLFEDPRWYPSHLLLLTGTALIAASLVTLVRRRTLAGVSRVHTAAVVAAIVSVAASVGMLLHLIAALDSGRIAAHQSTPLVDVNSVVETVTAPAFGLGIAALAIIAAMTRTLGGWPAAPFGVIGGLAYALAGATFLFTDKLDPLFPFASGIAVWAAITGIRLLLRPRAGSTSADGTAGSNPRTSA